VEAGDEQSVQGEDADLTDPVSIIPNDHVRALMAAMLAGDAIQEDIEIILTDNAERYLKRLLYLEAMGLRPGNRLYDVAKRVYRAGALQRSVAAADMYLKLRMIKHPDMELGYYEAGGDGHERPRENVAPETTDVGTEDTAGDVAEGPKEAAEGLGT